MHTEFTPFMSLAGGLLIGLAAIVFMLTNGRMAGVSGIVAKSLPPSSDTSTFPQDIMFIIGLAVSPLILSNVFDVEIIQSFSANSLLLGSAGFIVGLGAVIGNGCTSGHGVCGISLLSVRSITATLILMVIGFAVVFVTRHVAVG